MKRGCCLVVCIAKERTQVQFEREGFIMLLKTDDIILQPALELLNRHLTLYGTKEHIKIDVYWAALSTNEIQWERNGEAIQLVCGNKSDALALLGHALQSQESKQTLKARFAQLGAMIDVSRNSVYTTALMKKLLCQLALMGYTECFLYMEDTYELPDYPYWNYRRGGYTTAELKELDDFADTLGIELIPCIQTLAHLRTALRWKYIQPMRDTADNLMVGDKETEKLVEAIIFYFSKTMRSRRIHVGMDEAVGLGTGRYRLRNGYKDHRELTMEHLKTVCQICKKYGMSPMIWDDMLFRDHTPTMNYYGDSDPITEQQREEYPDNLQFVYWDYYHNTKEEYAKQLRRRGCLDTVFAGGVWKWGGWAPALSKSFCDTKAAVQACVEAGISEILVTLWGDDGDEAPLSSVLPGLALFGLLRYGEADEAQTDSFCRLLSDFPLKGYQAMEKLDLIPGLPKENLEALIPHKLLLYGDMASELFMGSLTKKPQELVEHYQELVKEYRTWAGETSNTHIAAIMLQYAELAATVALRCKTAMALHDAWQKKDVQLLKEVQQLLGSLEKAANALHTQAVEVWSAECKGQGMEIIDLRLGGIQGRCRALSQRIGLYLSGQLDTLSELDERELPYQGAMADDGVTPGREAYGEIVTANSLCHMLSI